MACAGMLGACNGEEPAACLEPLPMDCEPSFPPTYDQLYDKLFSQSCGAPGSGGLCHAQPGRQGGLLLEGRAQAYESLLQSDRVVPEEPECSVIMQRIESDDEQLRMPLRGAKLPAGVRCAVQQWIANGAER